jgi:hypothetical protein
MSGTCSLPKTMANWLSAAPQSRMGIVHQGGVAQRQVHDLEDRLIADIGNCVAAVERFRVIFRNW